MKRANRIISIPRFTIFVALCTALIIFTGSTLLNWIDGSFYAEARSVDSYTTVCVDPGDTLWSIAQEYYPDMDDVREAVYSIEKANHLTTSVICAGQTLQLPMYAD